MGECRGIQQQQHQHQQQVQVTSQQLGEQEETDNGEDLPGGDVEPCQRPGSSGDSLSQGVATGELDEDVHGRLGEGEQGRQPIGMRAPFAVTKEEREQHELTHTPYRAWCPHCVRARGRNTPHRSRAQDHEQSRVPRIVLDYFFMSSADEAAHRNPLIVMLDEATGDKYARAVGQKG